MVIIIVIIIKKKKENENNNLNQFKQYIRSDVIAQNEHKINELLIMCGLFFYSDNNIYNYFTNILNIKYGYEIVIILPNKIRRNIKQLMKSNKMCKYIISKI